MQCYTELTPPTAVTHAVSLPFLSPNANNLIVAKTSLLQIFEPKTVVTEADTTTKSDGTAADASDTFLSGNIQRAENTSKLILVGEYTLSGTVTALARVRIQNTKSGGEALLVAFRDAKLSLIEWDPEHHAISTISIHYYEGEELQSIPVAPDLSQCQSFLSVDPGNRCAALKFGVRHLAILPFRQSGDDLIEDDYDPDTEMTDQPQPRSKATNGEVDSKQTPYTASFVLPLTALDPTLTHPVHLAFLYEYREPTFGIVSSSIAPAASLLQQRKDVLSYTVFTLDLEQREVTTLLSVSGLPVDISRVIPLPLPVGGALLVGSNEFIHVDQAGKTSAVAINEFAKQCSSFPMADQAGLALRLEGCSVEQLGSDSSDLLVVLNTGELAILSFRLDGRSVSSLSVQRIPEDRGGLIMRSAASCATHFGRGKLFLGSEDGDSILIGWTRRVAQLSRKRSHAEMVGEDADLSFDEDDLEDDDDLYAPSPTVAKQSMSSSVDTNAPYTFRIHDTLSSIAPMKATTLGAPAAPLKPKAPTLGVDNGTTLELVASTGRGRAGGIAVLKREIDPLVLQRSELPAARAIWSVHAKKPTPKGLAEPGKKDVEAELAADADYDKYVIVSRGSESGVEESAVYLVNSDGIKETDKGDFASDAGATVDVGTLAGGTRIVQVLRDSIKSYDSGKCSDSLFVGPRPTVLLGYPSPVRVPSGKICSLEPMRASRVVSPVSRTRCHS